MNYHYLLGNNPEEHSSQCLLCSDMDLRPTVSCTFRLSV